MTAPLIRGVPLLAALATGAAGLLVLGVQPLLYGAYVHEGLISETRLGLLAAVEVASIAIGGALAVALTRRLSARLVGLAGLLLLMGANLVPVAGSTPLLFVLRCVAGIGGGMPVAIAALAIARSVALNTASAGFFLMQASSQFAALQWFARAHIAPGSAVIQLLIAIVGGVSLLLLPLLPVELHAPVPDHGMQTASRVPGTAGLVALLAAGLFVGGSSGVWAYLGLWLETRGVAPEAVAPLLSAALIGQMAGALAGVFLGDRGRSGTRVFAMGLVMLGLIAVLLLRGPAGPPGWALVVSYGFCGMVAAPALTGFLVEADPSLRSLPYNASAQLMGAAIMPTLAGELFAAQGLDRVILFACGSIIASLTTILLALGLARRAA